jgi:hypothetical protein
MAGKSPRKPSKNTPVKKAAGQSASPASTVTPISEGVKHGEIQNRAAQLEGNAPVGNQTSAQKTAEQKTAGQITHHEIAQQIRVRAYELFEQRGRHEGHDHEDWAQAEVEILSKYQREKSA